MKINKIQKNKDKYITLVTKQKYPNKKFYKQIIPLNIYQTWHSKNLPESMKNAVNKIIKYNPEFNYKLYDDDDCRNFIKENFDTNVLNAFDCLKPGAYKADLFRYCYLYINGGCYFDNKMINRTPIRDTLNKEDDIYLCKDISIIFFKKGYYNAIIYCIKIK
jgi:mannosyltransferase OCH1-like enzyme